MKIMGENINMSNHLRKGIIIFAVAILIGVIISIGIYTGIIDEYTAHIITFGAINVIIALSLNLISGFTGQLALGHAGFMAVGAYTTAVLIMQYNVPLLIAILIGGIVTAFFGLLIGFPTLRLRGDYLAIVTLGFGEIIRVTMVYLEKLTGGAAGLKGVPAFTTVIELRPMLSFVWVYCFLVIVVILISNLIKSSPGRAIISVREDEIASNAMGINVFYYKMLAFVLSAFIAGIGGGLYAPFYRYLNPTSFNFMKSIDFIIIVVLGGMGSITGTIISGFVVTYLQEFLRFLEDFRLVIYALVLILMMLFKPTGLMGNKEFSIGNLIAKLRSKKLLSPKDVTKEGVDK